MTTRSHIHLPANPIERITDGVTAFVGSTWCIYAHTVWFVLWFVFRQNIDLLTLIVSLEAIYLSTLVMISQNRQAERDRKRDDIEAQEVEELYQINKQQLKILSILHDIQMKP